MPNVDKLLPCPFCGHDAEIMNGSPDWPQGIGCKSCKVEMWDETPVTDKWNTRERLVKIEDTTDWSEKRDNELAALCSSAHKVFSRADLVPQVANNYDRMVQALKRIQIYEIECHSNEFHKSEIYQIATEALEGQAVEVADTRKSFHASDLPKETLAAIMKSEVQDTGEALDDLSWVLSWAEVGYQSAPRGKTLLCLNDLGKRLRAALQRPQDGWKPIETAPRDGTEIIGRTGEAVFSMSWQERHPDGDPEGWCWASYTFGGTLYEGNNNLSDTPPTHWRPLPAAPTKHKENE